ncbi:MAG: hypothetical protein ACI85I_001440 [Arenicella sp.]|jgi:uncharacterized protein YehS (DUF1456 family)
MNNNDILRRVRYAFDFNDSKMIQLFGLGELETNRPQVSQWLKKDDDPELIQLKDKELSSFLNGLIIDKRGLQEGKESPKAESKTDNNLVLRKLKIALNLKAEDMLEIMSLTGIQIGKHELSALFRKPSQSQYRPCKDQFLRNFLHGLQLKYRGEEE